MVKRKLYKYITNYITHSLPVIFSSASTEIKHTLENMAPEVVDIIVFSVGTETGVPKPNPTMALYILKNCILFRCMATVFGIQLQNVWLNCEL